MSRLKRTRQIVLVSAILLASPKDNVIADTKSWDGGGVPSSWHDGANWNPNGVPGPTDDVIIDDPNAIVVTFSTGTTTINSLQCHNSFAMSGGTLNISSSAEVHGQFSVANGILGGSADFVTYGTLIWSGGSLAGPGRTIIVNGATFKIAQPQTAERFLSRSIDNHGAATWLNSSQTISCSNGIINNMADGTFTMSGSAPSFNGSASSAFNNYGAFVCTSCHFGIAFNNKSSGLVTANPAPLYCHLHGGGTQDGTFLVEPGATLSLMGSHVFNASAVVTCEGNLQIGSLPGPTINCPLIIAGDCTVMGGTTFNGPLHVLGHFSANSTLSQAVIINGPFTATTAWTTMWLDVNGPSEINVFTIDGSGSLSGSGDLIITEAFHWDASGVAMKGTGKTIIAEGATWDLVGNNNRMIARPFEVRGVANFTNGRLTITKSSIWVGNLRIADSGIFNASDSSGFERGVAVQDYLEVTVDSGGVLNIDVAGSTFPLAVPITNNGELNIWSSISGNYDIASNGLLNWMGGSLTGSGKVTIGESGHCSLTSPASKTLSRQMIVNGSVELVEGKLDGNGPLVVNGDMTWTGNSTMEGPGNTTIAPSGFCTIASPATKTLNRLMTVNGAVELVDGALTGSGNLVINADLTWLGDSTMAGTGTTTIAATGQCSITSSAIKTLNRQMIVNGDVQLDEGTLDGSGSLVVNGDMTWTGNSAMGGTGLTTIASSGSLSFPQGNFTRTLSRILENRGQATVNGSVLGLGGGTLRNMSSGILHLHGNTEYVNLVGTNLLSNLGTLNIEPAANVQVHVPFSNTGSPVWKDGGVLWEKARENRRPASAVHAFLDGECRANPCRKGICDKGSVSERRFRPNHGAAAGIPAG